MHYTQATTTLTCNLGKEQGFTVRLCMVSMEKLNSGDTSFLQFEEDRIDSELEKVAELYDTMRKETRLKSFCDLSKIKYRESINQYYLVINRKQFTAKSRKELIDKLFNHFCGISVTTFRQAFKEWMLWRRDIGTNSKTLKENHNEYHNFIEGSGICDMQVASISITNFEDFFYAITKDYAITSKRLSNVLSVLNGVMRRCVSRGIIDHNILSDVDMKVFRKRCRPSKSDKDNYTVLERKQILDYLKDKTDIYSLAIRLSFYLPLRISETCAIKYTDVVNGKLYIQRAKRTTENMDNNLKFNNKTITNEQRLKGNKATGFRTLPLTSTAIEIIELTHALYPNNEYLFMRNGKQLLTDTFNEELRKVCNNLGIKYRSSHQIRFTVATLLYSNGVPINELSNLLGHADTAITWHYIRKQEATDSTIQTMQAVLG